MDASDGFAACQIGNGPRNPQYARIAARGQPHGLRRLREQFTPQFVGRRMFFEKVAIEFGIGPLIATCIKKALALNRTSRGDPARNLCGTFRWWRQDKVCRAHCLHLDMQVDTIQQRPGYLRLIVGGTSWRAATSKRGIAQMTAAAMSEV